MIPQRAPIIEIRSGWNERKVLCRAGVGERVSPKVVLAGADRVALDAAGIALLRYFGCQTEVARGKIFEQEHIA